MKNMEKSINSADFNTYFSIIFNKTKVTDDEIFIEKEEIKKKGHVKFENDCTVFFIYSTKFFNAVEILWKKRKFKVIKNIYIKNILKILTTEEYHAS